MERERDRESERARARVRESEMDLVEHIWLKPFSAYLAFLSVVTERNGRAQRSHP